MPNKTCKAIPTPEEYACTVGPSEKTLQMLEEQEAALRTLLHGRCATCKHWRGNRKKVVMQLAEAEFKTKFLDDDTTWASWGTCPELRVQMDLLNAFTQGVPETHGVFGCTLYKAE